MEWVSVMEERGCITQPCRAEFPFTPSHCTYNSIWTEWLTPVELEYVPATHAVHAEDPAEIPPRETYRIRVAVSAIHIAADTKNLSVQARNLPFLLFVIISLDYSAELHSRLRQVNNKIEQVSCIGAWDQFLMS
jgi:hypothetical protein